MTYITAPSRNNVSHSTFVVKTYCSPKSHPRGPYDHGLSSDGVHVLILDPTQESCPKPYTHHDSTGRLTACAPSEETCAALDNLVNMLY